jgi:hypothetical protein
MPGGQAVSVASDPSFLVMAADEGESYTDIAAEYGIADKHWPGDAALTVAEIIAAERAATGKPTTYTKRQLEELNPAQAREYMITEHTAERVNRAVAIKEKGDTLQNGDIVLYTDPHDGKA